MEKQIQLLREWMDSSSYTVFFGGAGVSTESGLADFRSASTGLYHQPSPYDYPPDRVLSHTFYEEHCEQFFEYYRTKLLNLKAKPNYTHFALHEMEKAGKLQCIITQNADNLHQRAGSEHVIDLHGNVYENHCTSCGQRFGPEIVADTDGIPRCGCGGVIRPGIVLFDEVPDMRNVMSAVRALHRAELILIAGSSMRISSTSGLFKTVKKAKLVILNDEETAFDDRADLIIRGKLGKIFRNLWPSDTVEEAMRQNEQSE